MIAARPLTRVPEFVEAFRLQKLIWGFEDAELIPVRVFVTASRVGGQVFGAFDDNRMIGFCLAIPGIKAGGSTYLHSHMLGVLPEYRNSGVGRALKLAQRDEALAREIHLMEWTFDPLDIKNAYFNLERLGAIVRRYVLNQYGTTSSPLHAGLPTDRCIAEYWLASSRVETILAGQAWARPEIAARIPIPADIDSIREHDPARAREIQKRVSNEFVESISKGLTVIGFERTSAIGAYLLAKWESE